MLIYEEMRKSGFTSIVQIKGDVRTVLGKDVFYRFYEVRRAGFRTYAINVSCGLESEMYSFGSDRAAAAAIYEQIVEGTLTPCTLKDVAEDFNGGSGVARPHR